MDTNNGIDDLHDKLIDLELTRSDNRSSKVRRYLPAFVLLASFYYSFLLALGLAVGFIGTRVFFKLFVYNGKVDLNYINCGKWKIHVHHWLLGLLVLLIAWVVDHFYLPRFFVGVVLGIVIQDIYDFNDWHKVLVKNEEVSK
jgi:hypothetical protein